MAECDEYENYIEGAGKDMISGGSNTESFFNYMFMLSQKDKMELMNVVQYVGLAIIPIVIIVKLMKTYLPPFDDYKGNVEILIEVILQLVVLLIVFWFIHRFIMFIPTYSKENYSTMNVFHFIVPFIFILFTLDTTISKKVNILLNRTLIYLGLEKEYMQDVGSEEEIYTPPSIQVPCPGPMNNPYPQNTKEEANGKNYNQMYEKTTNKLVGASNPPQNVHLDQGPMAANEALGLSIF
jgi:hypothetical protein